MLNIYIMKKNLRLLMTAILMAVFGIVNASEATWYGYALYTTNGASWQNHFISFNTQNPNTVQEASETLPTIWAATYLDGYVWFVTQTRSLCKAPFDEVTQTIGSYETVVPQLEQYNLYIDMAYNPVDEMMYYLCQDSQYNFYLKRSSLTAPSQVEVVGMFNVRIWAFAINAEGQAYGVAYEEGNLHEINLTDATTTVVGPTGKEVWYTQSMAFDFETGELFWAQFATTEDHGFYQVNTTTGEATLIGEIGAGTQLAGLFMVPETTPVEPEIIDEIYVEGFTAPVWGEHPDYDIEVSSTAPYTIADVSWHRYVGYDDHVVAPDEYFDLEDANYYLYVVLSPNEGFVFDENPTVYFNGDNSIFSYGSFTGNDYRVYTIDYQVTDPTTGIAEQTVESIALWPNPATNVLYLDVMNGANVSVFDMKGRMVKQQRYEGRIDVSDLVSGIYAVKAEGVTVRFVKE